MSALAAQAFLSPARSALQGTLRCHRCRDPFVLPLEKKAEADAVRRRFAGGSCSDHIAILQAHRVGLGWPLATQGRCPPGHCTSLDDMVSTHPHEQTQGWQEACRRGGAAGGREFCWRNFLSANTMQMMQDMVTQVSCLKLVGQARRLNESLENLLPHSCFQHGAGTWRRGRGLTAWWKPSRLFTQFADLLSDIGFLGKRPKDGCSAKIALERGISEHSCHQDDIELFRAVLCAGESLRLQSGRRIELSAC